MQHDRYEGETLTPDARLSDVQASDYDLLVVPGGTCNVDRIRVNEDAITLAQEFAHEGKPIAAICHGAWLLVNAGLVAGKTAAPCRYIAADIENAGGHYVDEQLHVGRQRLQAHHVPKARRSGLLRGRNQGCVEVTESASGRFRHRNYRSLAANCPQAPSISWPRVSRSVAVMPARCRISRNRCSSSGLEAVHFEPSMGLSGIGLTWAQLSP